MCLDVSGAGGVGCMWDVCGRVRGRVRGVTSSGKGWWDC